MGSKGKKIMICLALLAAQLCFVTLLAGRLRQAAQIAQLLEEEGARERLRAQEIPADTYERLCGYGEGSGYSSYEYLLGYLFTGRETRRELDGYLGLLRQYRPREVRELEKEERAIWEDVSYFPIPLSRTDGALTDSFEDSWMFARSFGGERGHEGTDVMASRNERGHYPVVSMTDGVVEKVGWLKLGGYRIGVRSPSGGYFYYAHLYDYAKEFKEGDEVAAGELLGFMGDSGYGEEGTVGKFDVHLHVGIYLNDADGEEISVNPYWVLRWLEGRRLSYAYE